MLLKPISFLRKSTGGGGGNGLLTGLEHFLDLDETSGNAVDSKGGVTFTDNNTVGYVSGGAPDGGNCRDFDRTNTEYFEAAAGDVMDWTSGDPVTIALWFKSSDQVNTRYFYGHNAPNGYSSGQITSGGHVYCHFDATIGFKISAKDDDSWHSLVVTSSGNVGANTDKFYVDGTLQYTWSGGFEPGSAAFRVGAPAHVAPSGYIFDGQMCSLGIWKRELDSDDVAAWHNSGTNLRYADLTT